MQITIDLESDTVDTFLLLLDGGEKTSPYIDFDNDGGTGTNARITIGLMPGPANNRRTYTIEATTGAPRLTGSFTLTISAPSAVTRLAIHHGVPPWQQDDGPNVTGSGVKVGVIDIGFIGYSDVMELTKPRELPATVVARCYTDIGEFTNKIEDCETDTVHGTAVAEAIYDFAPGVELYISQPISSGDLREAVDWMVDQGVQIINYSVGWVWFGSGDGTSYYENAPVNSVDAAVAGGIFWANSAGNAAEDTWFGRYADADGDGFLEFGRHPDGTHDETNRVSLRAGRRYVFPNAVGGSLAWRQQKPGSLPVLRRQPG